MIFYFLFFFSAIFCVYRVAIGKRVSRITAKLIAINLAFLSLYFFADALSGDGINESVIYHLIYGVEGAGLLAFVPYIAAVLGVIVLSLFGAAFLSRESINCGRQRDGVYFSSAIIAGFLVSLLCNPLIVGFKNNLPLLTVAFSQGEHVEQAISEFTQSKIGRLVRTAVSGDASGVESKASNQTRKNVIWIYAESLERTYFNQSVFGDLLNGLSAHAADARRYTAVRQPWGTGWTIGGIVGSQCGLPLVTLGAKNGNSLANIRDFMPGAVCLGDVLKENDYFLEFIGGASSGFAGKGNFLKTHGFDTVLDRESLAENYSQESVERNEWGFYDDFVLSLLKERAITLHAHGAPFFLNGLTLDTHSPHGFVSPLCRSRAPMKRDNKIAAAIKCSDYLLADFIAWFKSSELYEDTLLVLSSDHLSMPNSLYDELTRLADERRLMFWVIGKDIPAGIVDREASTFDIGATVLGHTLAAADVSIGVGRNIEYSDGLYQHEFSDADLMQSVAGVQAFAWKKAAGVKSIFIDGANSSFLLGGQSYPFPALIHVDDGLFSDISWVERERRERFSDLMLPERSYVWLDVCAWSSDEQYRGSLRTCAHFVKNGVLVKSLRLSESDITRILAEDVGAELDAANPGLNVVAKTDYAVSTSGPGGESGVNGTSMVSARRGVNIFEKPKPGADWRLARNIDLCGEAYLDSADSGEEYRPAGLAVILVMDTAHCGNSGGLKQLAGSFGLKHLESLEFRQPYIALLENGGEVPMEFPGRVETRVVVVLPGL